MSDINLSEVVRYQNKEVIAYFYYHNAEFTTQEVEVLFQDLLSWLWLNIKRAKLGKKTYLFGPLLILDELWHSFILHTRDYMEFSINYFGDYVHHDIEPIGFEHIMGEEEIRDYLHDCFTYLGPDWVSRRFDEALVVPG